MFKDNTSSINIFKQEGLNDKGEDCWIDKLSYTWYLSNKNMKSCPSGEACKSVKIN